MLYKNDIFHSPTVFAAKQHLLSPVWAVMDSCSFGVSCYVSQTILAGANAFVKHGASVPCRVLHFSAFSFLCLTSASYLLQTVYDLIINLAYLSCNIDWTVIPGSSLESAFSALSLITNLYAIKTCFPTVESAILPTFLIYPSFYSAAIGICDPFWL